VLAIEKKRMTADSLPGAKTEISKRSETLGSLAKGLAILEVFSISHQRLSISEASRLTDTSPATARRCLRTLEQLGFVAFDGKYYRLTPRLSRLASAYTDLPLPSLARPHLDAARDATGKSVSLAVLEDNFSVFIARSEVDVVVTAAVKVGSRLPAPLSSTGRVLLASMEDNFVLESIDRLAIQHPIPFHPVPDRHEIMAAIEKVREDGFAHLVDIQNVVRTIAVPVVDVRGITHAAMSIVAFASQSSLEGLRDKDLPVLLRQASELGNKL